MIETLKIIPEFAGCLANYQAGAWSHPCPWSHPCFSWPWSHPCFSWTWCLMNKRIGGQNFFLEERAGTISVLRSSEASFSLDLDHARRRTKSWSLVPYGIGIGTKRGAMAAPSRAARASFLSLSPASLWWKRAATRTMAKAKTRIRRVMVYVEVDVGTRYSYKHLKFRLCSLGWVLEVQCLLFSALHRSSREDSSRLGARAAVHFELVSRGSQHNISYAQPAEHRDYWSSKRWWSSNHEEKLTTKVRWGLTGRHRFKCDTAEVSGESEDETLSATEISLSTATADRPTDGWMDGRLSEWPTGRAGRLAGRPTRRRTDGRMDGPTYGRTKEETVDRGPRLGQRQGH